MGLFTILAYLGPETMLPMTSVMAGVAGVLMMFGRNSVRWCSATVRRLASKPEPAPKPAARPRRIGTGPVGRIAERESIAERA